MGICQSNKTHVIKTQIHLQIEHWKVVNTFNLFNFQTNNLFEKEHYGFIMSKSKFLCTDQQGIELFIHQQIERNDSTLDNLKIQLAIPEDPLQSTLSLVSFNEKSKREFYLLPKEMKEQNYYQIHEGAVVKMGKQRIRLKQVNLSYFPIEEK